MLKHAIAKRFPAGTAEPHTTRNPAWHDACTHVLVLRGAAGAGGGSGWRAELEGIDIPGRGFLSCQRLANAHVMSRYATPDATSHLQVKLKLLVTARPFGCVTSC